MLIHKNFSLKSLNTFGLDVRAACYTELQHHKQLPELLQVLASQPGPAFFLSGGSNVLFISDYPGLVVRIATQGIEVIDETDDHVIVRAMAGEDWDGFVSHCVHNNWGGLENLTMIPGKVGTSPIQNIGAYGVEIKDSFYALEALELSTGKVRRFNKQECHFGYRDSFFKQEGRNRYIILSVTFRLARRNHELKMDYGPVRDALKDITNPGIADLMHAIRTIRSSKLPDPDELGNAGSFFKNPYIEKGAFAALKQNFPDIPSFEDSNGLVKIPAGWLIENAGCKAFREGDAGVHHKQALVLVNLGNARGVDILKLSDRIQRSVADIFGVELEREVNLVGGEKH